MSIAAFMMEHGGVDFNGQFSGASHDRMMENLLQQYNHDQPPAIAAVQPSPSVQKVVPFHHPVTVTLFQCPKCTYRKNKSRSCLQHIKHKHRLILNPAEIKHFTTSGVYKKITPTEDIVHLESISIAQIIQQKMNNSVVIDLSLDETEEEAIVKLITKCSTKELQQYTPSKLFLKLNGLRKKKTKKALSFIKTAMSDALKIRMEKQMAKVKRLKQDLIEKKAGGNSSPNRKKRSRKTLEGGNDNISQAREKAAKNLTAAYDLAKALNVKKAKTFSFPSSSSSSSSSGSR